LKDVITAYPSPPALRQSLLDHLYSLLQVTLPDDPLAIKLLATRGLAPDLDIEAFVDALKTANEKLVAAVSARGAGVADVYAAFVVEWCGRDDLDDHLVRLVYC
jgi:U3 small nucleolar RNA-associated protein 6